MSEEPVEPAEPESSSTEELPEAYTSPLRIMLSEIHEIYQELLVVGFGERLAVQVVAHMIQDAMMYRGVEDDDESDDDTELDDESDNNDNRGFE